MTLSRFRGISAKSVLRALGHELLEGPLTDVAAQLSYFFLFSLFPLLFFLFSLLPYLHLGGVVEEGLAQLRPFVPSSAMQIVQIHLRDLANTPRPKLLSIGLLLAIWTASRGVNAFRSALNIAYKVDESRPFLRVQALCVGVMLGTTLLLALCFGLMLAGGQAGVWLAEQLQFNAAYIRMWAWLRWPLSALMVFATLAMLYYVLPDVKQDLLFLLPGSLTATSLWLLMTWSFTQYVEHFGNYNATYGAVGGVIVLMTWLYLSGLIFLIGGKLNALLEQASVMGKAPGARSADDPGSERAAAPPQCASASQ